MDKVRRFAQAFVMPPAMLPYVHLIATEQEMDLVIGVSERAMTLDEVAEYLRVTRDEATAVLATAYRRELVNKQTRDEVTTYSVANFYNYVDYWTCYEPARWESIPLWVRHAVNDWELQEWIKLWSSQLETIIRDPDCYVRMKNRDIVLLDESLDLIEHTDHICLLGCSCQTPVLCDTPHPPSARPVIEGSMRVGERARVTLERGQGRSLTKDEAKAHLILLDRRGLVHTMIRNWKQHDPNLEWMSHGNCDPGYSFPFRAGFMLGLAKKYPRSHYQAELDWSKCTHCGMCIGRCPFGAFYRTGSIATQHGQSLREITYDPDKCFGCGLCANTCPEQAVAMRPL